MAKQTFPQNYAFAGFDAPTFTAVPDIVFDYFLPRLSGSELKVLMYIIRRTLGFKKSADDISLKQLVSGITTQDGRTLDEGTGLAMPTVVKAIQELEKKNIILARRNRSEEKGDEATTYALNFKGDTVLNNLRGGSKKTLEGGLKKVKTQHTVIQETEKDVVVDISPSLDLLESYGIHYGVAEQLAMGYPLKYIEEKIAILKGLPKAPDNAAGWLRRAIEQNYPAPKALKTSGSKRKKAVKTAPSVKSEPAAAEPENGADWRLPEAPVPGFDGPAKMQEIWKTAYNELQLQLPRETFDTWLRTSHILAYKDDVLTIGVPNIYAREWLEHRLKKTILRVLQRVAKDASLDITFAIFSREG